MGGAKEPMNQMNKHKFQKLIYPIISLFFILWGVLFIFRSSTIAIDGQRYFILFDDAMISMRYAWNLSHGFGLVWNSFEYVEGYTNFLMTLFMALATLSGDKSSAVFIIQFFGIFLILGIAIVSKIIAEKFVEDEYSHNVSFVGFFTFICCLSYYPLVYWSLMGMETGLLTILLLTSILFAFSYLTQKKERLLPILAINLGLLFLTRNDTLIYALIILVFIFWRMDKTRKGSKWFLISLSLFILILVGYEAFRYYYYNELIPNTYTLKLSGMPFFFRIQDGVSFIRFFFYGIAILTGISIIDLFTKYKPSKILLFAILLSAVSYQIYVGGDPWDYWRMLSPAMPGLFILFVVSIISIVDVFAKTVSFRTYYLRKPIIPIKYASSFIGALFIVVGIYISNRGFLDELFLLTPPFQSQANWENVNIAVALNDVTTNDASLAVFWAGTIPYYTGKKSIDCLGKSDKYIAQLPPDLSGKVSWEGMRSVPGHNKYDLNYSIIKNKPTYVQSFKWGGQDISSWAEVHYDNVTYKDVKLSLLKKSPEVYWDELD